MSQSKWTHRICERCYFDSDFGIIHEGEHAGSFKTPVQLAPDMRQPGACCYCGGFVALTGIYVREDPKALICQGRHDDLSAWSRVGVADPASSESMAEADTPPQDEGEA